MAAGVSVWISAIAALALGAAVAAQDCGGPDAPCEIETGAYHVALPEGAPTGTVVWLHGYGSSGASAVRNQGFASRFTDRGFALVAPSGIPEPAIEGRNDWAVDDGYAWSRDDVAFLGAVVDDATARFDLNPDRVFMAGFSRGGSMVWDFACAAPGKARAYAAVAGGFWEPIQQSCTGPAHLHHTHGFSDGMVPFEGRAVTFLGIDFTQGNIMKGLDTWRAVNGCRGRADETVADDALWQKAWGCDQGSLTLHLTTGGHGIPEGWTARILDWFEAVAPPE